MQLTGAELGERALSCGSRPSSLAEIRHALETYCLNLEALHCECHEAMAQAGTPAETGRKRPGRIFSVLCGSACGYCHNRRKMRLQDICRRLCALHLAALPLFRRANALLLAALQPPICLSPLVQLSCDKYGRMAIEDEVWLYDLDSLALTMRSNMASARIMSRQILDQLAALQTHA